MACTNIIGIILFTLVFHRTVCVQLLSQETICKRKKPEGGDEFCPANALSCKEGLINITEVDTFYESCKSSSRCEYCCLGYLTPNQNLTHQLFQRCTNHSTCDVVEFVLSMPAVGLATIIFSCIPDPSSTTVPTTNPYLTTSGIIPSGPDCTLVYVLGSVAVVAIVAIGICICRRKGKFCFKGQCNNTTPLYQKMEKKTYTENKENGIDRTAQSISKSTVMQHVAGSSYSYQMNIDRTRADGVDFGQASDYEKTSDFLSSGKTVSDYDNANASDNVPDCDDIYSNASDC